MSETEIETELPAQPKAGKGVQTAASGYDIGLYYQGDLDIAALEQVARTLDTPVDGRTYQPRAADAPRMTGIGGWGPWVNGGGWLTIDGQPVDILYRDAARVERVIGEVPDGRFECAYHYGHPHAFVSTIYAGEGIAQIIFMRAEEVCKTSYADKKGKYQDQPGLTLPFVPGTRADSPPRGNT